eukprot:UN1353
MRWRTQALPTLSHVGAAHSVSRASAPVERVAQKKGHCLAWHEPQTSDESGQPREMTNCSQPVQSCLRAPPECSHQCAWKDPRARADQTGITARRCCWCLEASL